MPTRGNGEGSVYFNKQRKKWNAQYKEYDVNSGKMKSKTKSFKSEDEAKKYLSTIMYQKENSLYIEHHGIPMCELLKQNLNLKRDTNQISASQYSRVLINKPVNNYKYRNVFLIQMYMGLRVGEALALSTHDIDLQHKKINVHRTLSIDEIGNVIMGNKTKTYAGKRILPIPDFLYPYIVEQMQIANNQINNDEKLLFKPLNCKYAKRSNVNNELKRILKKEFNITGISTHSLRHTFGTRCIESGMAPVVVQRLMGHKDISITLNTYTSVFDKFKENEIDKVNQYYLRENLDLNQPKQLAENEK